MGSARPGALAFAFALVAAPLGCERPAPARPHAVPAAAVEARPTIQGSLLVYGTFGVAACRPRCALLDDPALARPARVPRRTSPGRYLFASGVLRVEGMSLTPLPTPLADAPAALDEGALWFLDDGTLVHVEHLATADRVRISRDGAPFAPLSEAIPKRGYELRFLPDGRHLFKTAPLMGKKESPHFIDVIAGQTVTLFHVPSIGGTPKALVSRPQTMHADFAEDGAAIVYWVPGAVDEDHDARRLSLESVDVATGKTTPLGVVTAPVFSPDGKLLLRDTPRTIHHVRSRYVVHESELDREGAHAVRIVDVVAITGRDVPLGGGERLVPPFDQTHPNAGGTDGRRDDDVLVLAGPDPEGTRVRVLSLEDLAVVLEVVVPSPDVFAVDYVATP